MRSAPLENDSLLIEPRAWKVGMLNADETSYN
jgi:hypothetical protein